MPEAVSIDYRRVDEAALKRFVVAALVQVGIAPRDAAIVAEVLVAADLRGIESHGVARLVNFYVDRIRAGTLNPTPHVKVVRETETSILLDADNGLGHPAAKQAMEAIIAKAKVAGSAFATVRNSNHYGIAGYYAMLALEHDMIGISSTTSVRYAAPTFGKDVLLGTNPLAFAIPTAKEPPFVLDFATTTVPRGKIEVYERKGLPLKPGWAIAPDGLETDDAEIAMAPGGGLLPLGGFGTDSGGHKGYGLGLLVDILCGVLSGGAFGTDLPVQADGPQPGKVANFFAVFRIDGFRDPDAFKADMDAELRNFKDSQRAPGAERIYVAGEIEHERTLANRAAGVPIHAKVWASLEQLAGELGVAFELA
jgi:L-2-hydroxycarboxylate dehydrogenase (NAD+)